MEETKKLKQLREINLSEILIRNEKNLDIKKAYNEIVKSIQDIGFKNTSSIIVNQIPQNMEVILVGLKKHLYLSNS